MDDVSAYLQSRADRCAERPIIFRSICSPICFEFDALWLHEVDSALVFTACVV